MDGLPGFILQCSIKYADRTEKLLITDETWKTSKDMPYRSGTVFQQNRRISAILDYDARKEENGWLQSNFDDSHWESVQLSQINNEAWVMKPQIIPEGKIYEEIIPLPVGIQEKGLQVFDAGKIITGWPQLELSGI